MTNQMESASVPSGQGVPTPAPGVANGQPTSPAPVTFTPEQVEYLKPFIEQQAQSTKDRRIADLEKAVAELRGTRSEPTPQAPQTQVPSPANGVTQVAQPAETDYLSPIKKLGLDANDKDVLGVMMQYGKNPTEFTAKLMELAINRDKQPPASPAAAMPSNNSVGTGGSNDITGITDVGELLKLAKDERGNFVLPKRR